MRASSLATTSCALVLAAGTATCVRAAGSMTEPWRAAGIGLRANACMLGDTGQRGPLRAGAAHAAVYCELADCTTGVAVGAHPAFHFSRGMNAATINPATIGLTGPDALRVAGAPVYLGGAASFVPDAKLAAGTTYTLSMSDGVHDSQGHALARNYICSFTTAPAMESAALELTPPPAAQAAVAPPAVARVAPAPIGAWPWYAAPLVAYAFPTCEGCVRHGLGWQLALGKVVSRHWNLELGVIDRDLDLKRAPGSSHDTSFGANALWFPDRALLFAPFVLAGAGANHQTQSPEKSSTVPYGALGAGLLVSPLHWNPVIRAGLQWIRPFGGDYCGKGDTTVGLGLQFHFGG